MLNSYTAGQVPNEYTMDLSGLNVANGVNLSYDEEKGAQLTTLGSLPWRSWGSELRKHVLLG